jgi:hypothetical protein
MVKSFALKLVSQPYPQLVTILYSNNLTAILCIGSVTRPTLVSFTNARRVYSEEAFAQITAEYTLPLLSMMIGKTLEQIQLMTWSKHLRVPVRADEQGRLYLTINHNMELNTVTSNDHKIYVTALLAMYIASIHNQVLSIPSTCHVTKYCFSMHTTSDLQLLELHQACLIAGISTDNITIVSSIQCLVATYARKISGLGGPGSGNVQVWHCFLLD